jgi:glyoxylase-like metal-dependent hydrolase (beta-lactamase superfamily II)
LRQLGLSELRLIYLTHAHLDHYGSAAALKSLTGAPIAIHRLDSQALGRGETHLGQVRGRGRLIQAVFPLIELLLRPSPLDPDVLLEDGDRLDEYGLAGQIVHTPGHTDGSSALWLKEGILFAGDLVSSIEKPHVQRFFAQNWTSISESLQRLQDLKPKWVYPGHGARPLSQREFLEL